MRLRWVVMGDSIGIDFRATKNQDAIEIRPLAAKSKRHAC
jgi:hypothetical protein